MFYVDLIMMTYPHHRCHRTHMVLFSNPLDTIYSVAKSLGRCSLPTQRLSGRVGWFGQVARAHNFFVERFRKNNTQIKKIARANKGKWARSFINKKLYHL